MELLSITDVLALPADASVIFKFGPCGGILSKSCFITLWSASSFDFQTDVKIIRA